MYNHYNLIVELLANIYYGMEKKLDKLDTTKSKKQTIFKDLTGKALISALILFGASEIDAQVLTGVTSQKQAIDILKSQGKILPNVATDYDQYGKSYLNAQALIYNTYPYGRRAKYEANNLKNVNGKNIEIDNDVDSCNFLNETVYKANLDKIVPIIIDTQIDTLGAAPGEYERIDRANSRSFIDGFPKKETITTKTGTGFQFGTHANAMADVMVAKKDNFTENDYQQADQGFGKLAVGIRPGKARLYVNSPAIGGEFKASEAIQNIYNEAKINPDKKYLLSCSRTGADDNVNNGFDKLTTLPNVIIFVARNDKVSDIDPNSYANNPATVEVGYVTSAELTVDPKTYALSFNGTKRDREVPMDTPQSGRMKGDGFCVLGEYSTSTATVFMSSMTANLRAQNPSRTRDQILAILKRDVYKSSEYVDNASGWNDMTGYGIPQFGMSMKENVVKEIFKEDIFSNQKTSLNKKDGKFYFAVPTLWNTEYSIIGEGVKKDDKGYYIDLSVVNTGKHTFTFVGKCNYEGKVYDFPISRELTVVGLDNPIVTGISSHRQRTDATKTKVYFENLKGQIINYKTGLKVNLKFPDGTKISNVVVDAQGNFNLSNTSSYPVVYNSTGSIVMTVELEDTQGNKNTTDVSLTSDLLFGIEKPIVTGVLSTRQRIDSTRKKIYFENIKGKITNYKTGLKVNLKFPDGTKLSNITIDAQGNFNLSNTSSSPVSFNEGDSFIKVVVEFEDAVANISTSEITLNANFVLLENPIISGISGHRQRADANKQQVYFEFLKGQITNYKIGQKVNLKFNNSTTISNITVDSQGNFNLTNTIAYPISYKRGDGDIKMTVEIVDFVGNKAITDVMLTGDLVTDVEEIPLDETANILKVYPNPVIDILNIDIPSSFGKASVKIFNTSGQLYSASNLSSDNNQIDLSSLKPGLYFVTVSDDKGNKKTEKIIKR